jgi:FtsH-binding integral membrane protein
LRRENELKQLNTAAAANQQRAARGMRLWRSLSILTTSLTSGWITWLTIGYVWDRIYPDPAATLPQAPWGLIIFNTALMFGLFRLVRAMKGGPVSVFTSAAFAIVCCMPLNVALGMPLPTIEQMNLPKDKYTEDQIYWAWIMFFGCVGFCFSLPVWFTALKLAAQSRLARIRKS